MDQLWWPDRLMQQRRFANSTAKGLRREATTQGETILHEVHIPADTVNQQSRDKRE
jgi:hypothetical protein